MIVKTHSVSLQLYHDGLESAKKMPARAALDRTRIMVYLEEAGRVGFFPRQACHAVGDFVHLFAIRDTHKVPQMRIIWYNNVTCHERRFADAPALGYYGIRVSSYLHVGKHNEPQFAQTIRILYSIRVFFHLGVGWSRPDHDLVTFSVPLSAPLSWSVGQGC